MEREDSKHGGGDDDGDENGGDDGGDNETGVRKAKWRKRKVGWVAKRGRFRLQEFNTGR